MKNKFYILTHLTRLTVFMLIAIGYPTSFPVSAQTAGNRQAVQQSMEKSNTILDKFSSKCERRTQKAEKRFARYEKKIQEHKNSKIIDPLNGTALNEVNQESLNQLNQKSTNGLGKEPLLDSIRLVYGFA